MADTSETSVTSGEPGNADLDADVEKPREAEPTEKSGPPAPVEVPIEQQLAERDDTIRGLREQILRMQADFENYKKRQQNSLEDVKYLAREQIVGSMLPLLDNFERALQASETTGNIQAMVEGLQLMQRQMKDILVREGVVEIPSEGEIFDPALHQAVMREEREDVPDQTVLQTLQKGYRLGARVLRPSLVKVACMPEGAPNQEEESTNA